MDLDNIKKAWNEDKIIPPISKDKIYCIINKRAKTALEKLLIFEILGSILLLPLLFVPYFHSIVFPTMPYPVFTKYLFITLCVIGVFWQIYKFKLLKKIDVSHTSIISCSKYISKYKLYIKKEMILAVLFLLIFIFSFGYSYIEILPSDQDKLDFTLFNILVFVVACVILLIYYKVFYYKRIKHIEASLEEAREMEKDN